MANFSVREVWEDRTSEVSAESGRSYNRTFLVESDDPSAGPDEVQIATGIPQVGDPYLSASGSTDLGATVRTVRIVPEKGPSHWKVSVKYSTESASAPGGGSEAGSDGAGGGGSGGGETGGSGPGGSGGGGSGSGMGGGGGGASPSDAKIENPLLRLPVLRYGSVKYKRVARQDRDGVAIVNGAGAAFDPPVEMERTHLTINVQRNQALFDRDQIRQFVNAINSKPWFGFPKRTVRCTQLDGERLVENGVLFWKVSFTFEFNPDDWRLRVLNAGWYYLEFSEDFEPDGRRLFLDSFGRQLPTPGLLAANGDKLPIADDPIFLKFSVYLEQNFKELGLGG